MHVVAPCMQAKHIEGGIDKIYILIAHISLPEVEESAILHLYM